MKYFLHSLLCGTICGKNTLELDTYELGIVLSMRNKLFKFSNQLTIYYNILHLIIFRSSIVCDIDYSNCFLRLVSFHSLKVSASAFNQLRGYRLHFFLFPDTSRMDKQR